MHVLEHYFAGGDVYLKAFILDDNECVPQHKHVFDHVTLLVAGCVILDNGQERTIHHAPDFIFIKKGITHSFTAVNGPAKGYCTHITDCMDINEIDGALTA